MPRRVHRLTPPPLPPVFARIIHAAKHGVAGETSDRIGHGAALEELSAWALVNVPSRGVLAPRDDHAYRIIQAIAARHLGYADASQSFQRAIKVLGNAGHDVESTANHLRSIGDDAYYYAGLASGLALLTIERGEGWR